MPTIFRHKLYLGLQARIARQLNVSASVVNRVVNGSKTSKRISNAIAREVNRIEREISRRGERAA